VLRRTSVSGAEPAQRREIRAYRFGDFEFNLRTRRLRRLDGANIALTNGEINLLAALLASPGRILTRDQLLEASRVHDNEVYDRAIDIQVLRLRRKIETDPTQPRYIITQRGAGYIFSATVEVVY
jgi:DNA-binding response OmpR family regulator